MKWRLCILSCLDTHQNVSICLKLKHYSNLVFKHLLNCAKFFLQDRSNWKLYINLDFLFESVHCYTLCWNSLDFDVYEGSETMVICLALLILQWSTKAQELLAPTEVRRSWGHCSPFWAWYYQTALQWQMWRCTRHIWNRLHNSKIYTICHNSNILILNQY